MNVSRVREPATVDVLAALPGQAAGGWASAGGIGARTVTAAPRSHPDLVWSFPPWLPPSGNGLVAVVLAAAATRGWVESLLAIDGACQVVWAGLDDRPESPALDVVERFTLPAATLVHTGTDARQAWVALQVAVWLSGRRAAGGGLARSCLTSWTPPRPPAGTVRVPHLVSICHGTTTRDAVVWELADLAAARELVGLPAGWEVFDRHVPALLDLRAALRGGRLPASPLARRVLELTWERGRELSIELVYRNADLFRVLVQAWRPSPSSTGGEL